MAFSSSKGTGASVALSNFTLTDTSADFFDTFFCVMYTPGEAQSFTTMLQGSVTTSHTGR